MKYIYITFISFLFILGTSSCDKYLDIDPQQSVDAATALDSPEKLESAIFGCYSILGRGQLYGTNFVLVPELLGSEEHARWQGTFQSYRELDRKNALSTNTEASRTWISAFEGINLANNVLKNIDIIEDVDMQNQIKGEALFIRGILYFELVRLYAKDWNDGVPSSNFGLPLTLVAVTTEAQASVKVPRSTVDETYQQIEDDLIEASNLLAEDPSYYGFRANRFTALAFLAKMYLQKSDFGNARDAANEVIESGFYRLNPSVIASFRNDNTPESIFEIQQNDQNNAGRDNDGLATFFASLPGLGRGDVQVISDYDEVSNPIRYTTYDLYEEEDARLNELFYIGTGRRSGRIRSSKWVDPGANLPIVRLAEMYLIRAEANNRLGTSIGADALDDVNLIRNRAGLLDLVTVDLDAILLERRLELAFEGNRIHDVKRLQIDLVGRFADDGTVDYTIDFNDNSLVMPIPQREIDAYGDVELQQNGGY